MPHNIGEVSEKTGFSADTLRYYEKIGLISDIARTTAGQRRYSDDNVAWLLTLRCLRDTGMPIAEMQRFAELAEAGDHTVPERITLLREHHVRVAAHIDDLLSKQQYITSKIDWYLDHFPGK